MPEEDTFLFTFDDQKSIQSVEDRIVSKICGKSYVGGRNYLNPSQIHPSHGVDLYKLYCLC